MSEHLTVEIRQLTGESLGVLVLSPKVFSSGKAGYFGQSKVIIAGQRYQCQCQMVGIVSKASKPKPEPKSESLP